MEEYKKFGDLTREEKLALMAAWVDGEKIQWWVEGWATWNATNEPNWQSMHAYRIAPKPVVKPYINWDHVSEKYVALGIDRDGRAFLHPGVAAPDSDAFYVDGGDQYCFAAGFSSFTPGSFVPNKDGVVENWQDSLVFRPGYEPKGERE